MAYPVRLEVATLVGDTTTRENQATGLRQASSAGVGLPQVADTTNATSRQAVFVIGDSAKRPKTAGMLGSGRVAPMTTTDNLRPGITGPACLCPSPRPRSSPRIRRRHTRVTPLPPTTQLQLPPDARNTAEHTYHKVPHMSLSEDWQGACNTSHPSKVPKWKRDHQKQFHKGTSQDDNEGLWPSSSLDSGLLDHAPTFPTNTTSSAMATTQGAHSPWLGRYTVPIINIASDNSSAHPLRSSTSLNSDRSDFTSLEHSRYVTERIHNLVTAFSQRANRVKAQITQPPTPSTELSDGCDDAHKAPDIRQRLDSLVPDISSRSPSLPHLVGINTRRARLLRFLYGCKKNMTFPKAMEPQSRLYISWLLVTCIMYVYNAWVIPLRSVFSEYQTKDNLGYWLAADYLADLVYILDIVVFKSRVMYLDNGFWVSTPKLMRRHYLKTSRFRYDLASLLPLDLLYFKFGPISVFRLPRLIKIQTFWEFFNRLDSVLSSPHAIRVIRTVLYMLFLIHLNTCAYYGFSVIEGIGSNKWVFQGVGNAYIRCFYFATKTATSIGKNPKPQNEAEYLFMTCSWLMGVFVFALLIGQIRDIVATATHNQNEYRKVMDQTQAYLHRLNLPASLQERVRLWFTYTWQNQKTLNEMKCLESLPRKMRTDIAINVHIQTLSKVQLFQDCDKALLRDLVLKLKPVLYLPGDFVCKKGEVGKEMYIVQSGQVLVMGGERGDVVLATLGEGSVFGEISLLALAGGNRRTANVRSRGFSSLFVLSKADLQATIKDYPEAQEILKKKAKRLIKQNQAREESEPHPDENIIIKSRENTPKLLHAVLQVVHPDSFTASIIRRSSRTISRSTLDIPSLESLSLSSAVPWTPSSMSLEVPIRSSRRSATAFNRSSLEVPGTSSRPWIGSIPKTSMSESLQEEEEEEEFLVVETSEVEGCNEHLLGSPVSSTHSHHSISLLRGSRPTTPQSIFSTHSSLHSSPSTPHLPFSLSTLHQGDGRLDTHVNRPTSPCEDSLLQPELEQSPSAGHSNAGVRSGLSKYTSASSLQCSPGTLAQQSCNSALDQQYPLSSAYGNIASFPVTQPVEAQELHTHGLPATDQQQSCFPKHDHQQRSCKKLEENNGQILGKDKNKNNHKHKDQISETKISNAVIRSLSDSCSQRNKKATISDRVNSSFNIINTIENGIIVREKSGKAISETQEYRENDGSRTQSSRGSKSFKYSASLKSNKNGRKNDCKSSRCTRGNSSASTCKEFSHEGQSINKDLVHSSKTSANHAGKDSTIEMLTNDCSYMKNIMVSDLQTPNEISKTRMSGSGKSGQHEDSLKQQEALLQTNSSSVSSANIQDGSQPHASPFSVFPLSIKHSTNCHSSSSHSSSSHSSSSYSLSNNNLSTNINSSKDFLIKYGLSSSVESGIISDTPVSCLDSITSGGSYDIFLTELSKTLPSSMTQGPSVASSVSSGSPSRSQSSPLAPALKSPSPIGSVSCKISCSAIVHRECSPPDTSPFDTQESKL
ncbi:uncharacterized protein CngB isoform X3 [Panulirus ornatus]